MKAQEVIEALEDAVAAVNDAAPPGSLLFVEARRLDQHVAEEVERSIIAAMEQEPRKAEWLCQAVVRVDAPDGAAWVRMGWRSPHTSS